MFSGMTNPGSGLFDDFGRFRGDMDELFGSWPWPTGIRSVVRGTYPPLNVGATPEQVNIYIFAAGLDPDTLDISMQQNLLSVAGKREAPSRDKANYYRKERFDGSFRRVISLPEDVDPDQVNARYRDGVLHVQVQRRQATPARQIQIQ